MATFDSAERLLHGHHRFKNGYASGSEDVDGRKTVRILRENSLAQHDLVRQVPVTMCAIADAIRWAEEIMREIHKRWPGRASSRYRCLVFVISSLRLPHGHFYEEGTTNAN